MGLRHSGEVADAGFWIAAEMWLLITSVRQWCSFKYWRRFKDYIFAITSNFLVFNMFSDGSALVERARVSSSWQRMSAKARLRS